MCLGHMSIVILTGENFSERFTKENYKKQIKSLELKK